MTRRHAVAVAETFDGGLQEDEYIDPCQREGDGESREKVREQSGGTTLRCSAGDDGREDI